MQRQQYDGEHEYLVSPESVGDYPITDNETHSTYDQFIQLRDTLIFSGKYYNDKAGAKLIVGASKETIEVIWKNWFKLSFEPGYNNNVAEKISIDSEGPYVDWLGGDPQYATLFATYGPLSCIIKRDGHYLICHKEEIGAGVQNPDIPEEKPIPNTVKQVLCHVLVYREQAGGTYPANPTLETAVFDRYAFAEKTFSGTTSGTEPNGSCSVKVSLTLGDIFRKITSFGYNERDLKKNDILVLKCVDQDGNELPYQSISNFFQVQYIDLPKDN